MAALRERGMCLACGYYVRVRRNGFPERHYLYIAGDKYACSGGEQQRLIANKPSVPIYKRHR